VEDLTKGGVRGDITTDGERPGISNAVLSNKSPLFVRILGLKRKCQVGTEFRLRGGDRGGHPTGGAVCDDADRILAICGIRDRFTVEGAGKRSMVVFGVVAGPALTWWC
jgi:hypothetical protein